MTEHKKFIIASGETLQEVTALLLFVLENFDVDHETRSIVHVREDSEVRVLVSQDDGGIAGVIWYHHERDQVEYISECSDCACDISCTEPGITICCGCAMLSARDYEETVEGNWRLAVSGK